MKWFVGVIIVVLLAGIAWYFLNTATMVGTPAQTATSTASGIIPGIPDETYTDRHLSFSIQYPSSARSTPDFSDGYLPLTATPVIAFQLPGSMFSGTNLVDAGVYIGASTSPSVMTGCTGLSNVTGQVATATTTIGGQNFVEIDSTQAAAGNLYQQKTFRAFQNGYCLEISEVLHSGNIGNYTPGTVTQFDQAMYQGILDAIVGTYYPIPTGQ